MTGLLHDHPLRDTVPRRLRHVTRAQAVTTQRGLLEQRSTLFAEVIGFEGAEGFSSTLALLQMFPAESFLESTVSQVDGEPPMNERNEKPISRYWRLSLEL